MGIFTGISKLFGSFQKYLVGTLIAGTLISEKTLLVTLSNMQYKLILQTTLLLIAGLVKCLITNH